MFPVLEFTIDSFSQLLVTGGILYHNFHEHINTVISFLRKIFVYLNLT
jgi:hypothetical protein